MAEISFGELRAIAARLGHRNLSVVRMRSGSWYRVECSCGMRSKRYALESEAVKLAVSHFELVASGDWWKPKYIGGPSYAEATRRTLLGEAKVARRRGDDAEAQRLEELAHLHDPRIGTRHAENEPSRLRAVG